MSEKNFGSGDWLETISAEIVRLFDGQVFNDQQYKTYVRLADNQAHPRRHARPITRDQVKYEKSLEREERKGIAINAKVIKQNELLFKTT